MTLIQKHASPLALLSVLGAVCAAPYLIPENPDSAVFRSGTLGLLLMLACCAPLKEAFSRASLRTLVCGAAFGLLLGGALSLGAELRFYGGLLPGMGSMLRRAVVPVMIAPLLGGLAARIMLLRPTAGHSARMPMWAYMAVLLLCWLPLLIAYYPGMLNYDVYTEYQQYLAGEWDARHPMLYIIFTYSLYALGGALGSPTLGMLLATLARMLALAAALAYSCVFIQRRRAPAWLSVLVTAGYALLPVFSVMSVSSAKDTPFAAALLVLSLLAWEMLDSPETFFEDKRRCAAFAMMTILVWHMRKNGVAAMLMLPLLIAASKGHRAKAAKLCAISAALCMLLSWGINAALKPVKQPSFQTYSIPAQQLARAYNLGEMTEEEREELRSWYIDSDWGLQLLPHLADAAKGSLDPMKLEENGGAFMDLWARVGRRNIRIYAEAFLMLNQGAWYPDDRTHADIYRPYGLDKGYLQTDEYDLSAHGVDKYNPLPAVRRLFERICRRNVYLKYPIVSQFLCTATPLWAIVFSIFVLLERRRGRLALAASGMLALWLSYLFGPCTLARYMLPLFCFAPAMLAAACLSKEDTP